MVQFVTTTIFVYCGTRNSETILLCVWGTRHGQPGVALAGYLVLRGGRQRRGCGLEGRGEGGKRRRGREGKVE